MISPEKEVVAFSKIVDVNLGERKGQVEIWLLEIEAVMRSTLRLICKQALHTDQQRNDFIINFPAMVVLVVNMIQWTVEAETALE